MKVAVRVMGLILLSLFLLLAFSLPVRGAPHVSQERGNVVKGVEQLDFLAKPGKYATPPMSVLMSTCPSSHFFPLVLNPPAPPSAPPRTPFVPLRNGGFENGRIAWQESSTYEYELILHQDYEYLRFAPHCGEWLVWLGGLEGETSMISQEVTVPVNASYLGYWHLIESADDTCSDDFGFVRVNESVVDGYYLCVNTSTSEWRKRVVDLSLYAGQTVTLDIRAVNDTTPGSISNLFIDDIAFQTTPSSRTSAAHREDLAISGVSRRRAGE
ncbi:MAG: hypothetical protein M3220_22730 [Chloroflexota bacterium]|nr:hypothetical protein [Chloroflexota bacterium]